MKYLIQIAACTLLFAVTLLERGLYAQAPGVLAQQKIANNFGVKGTVVDGQGKTPIGFATVLLLSAGDTTLVKGSVTDTAGAFTIEGLPAGAYKLRITYLGYNRYQSESFSLNSEQALKNLGQVLLAPDAQVLKEVVVTAERPAVEVQLGKMVVNVSNSLFKTANTALDVLGKSPGVTVSGDGAIAVKGATPVVTIDGKNLPLSLEEIRAIPSDQIESIEIISNPSARYEGDRKAIINIVMKRDKTLGMNGSVYAGYGRNRFNQYFTGTSITYKTRKWVFFGRYSLDNYNSFLDLTTHRRFRTGTEGVIDVFDMKTDFTYAPVSNVLNLSGDYSISKKSTVGFMIRGSHFTDDRDGDNQTTVGREAPDGYAANALLRTRSATGLRSGNYSANLNYRGSFGGGRELSVDLDQAQYDNNQNQLLQTIYETAGNAEGALRGDVASDLTIRSVKADYTHPLGDAGRLEGGFKSSWVNSLDDMVFDTLTNGNWVYDTRRSNQFSYKENIVAGYLQFSRQTPKWGYQMGLRLENTATEGNSFSLSNRVNRHYLRVLPSVQLQRKFNDHHSLSLGYARKLSRPSFQDLNPFIFYLDPYTYTEGNPFLMPANLNSVDLSYHYNDYHTSLTYRHNTNIFSQMPEQNDTTQVTKFTRVNLDQRSALVWDAWIPVKINKWWKVQTYLQGSYDRYKSNYLSDSFDNARFAYQFNTTSSFTLPFKATLNLSFYYVSPQAAAFYNTGAMYNVSGGLFTSLLKDRANLNITFNDLFYTMVEQASVQYLSIDTRYAQRRNSRQAFVRFTYKFGNSTFNRRNRNSGSVDEENRVRNF